VPSGNGGNMEFLKQLTDGAFYGSRAKLVQKVEGLSSGGRRSPATRFGRRSAPSSSSGRAGASTVRYARP